MIFNVALAVLSLVISLASGESTSLPSYIHTCKRSDPKVEECILKSIEEIRPYFSKGIPELGIPSADRLIIPEIHVPDSKGGILATGKNIQIFGASDFRVEKLKVDFSNPMRPTIHFALLLPKLRVEGGAEVHTKILSVPIRGKGSMKFDAVNTHADVVVYGQVYKKGNNNYLRFIRMDMLLNMEDYTIQLANLFNGDKVLEQATNTALNENKSEFKKAIGPTLTTVVTKFILDFANNVTKSHSYDTLFPN